MNKIILGSLLALGLATGANATVFTSSNETGLSTNTLENGEKISVSKNNSITITDITCPSGTAGFLVSGSNGKITQSYKFNSCTGGVLVLVGGETEEAEEAAAPEEPAFVVPDGHVAMAESGYDFMFVDDNAGNTSLTIFAYSGEVVTLDLENTTEADFDLSKFTIPEGAMLFDVNYNGDYLY